VSADELIIAINISHYLALSRSSRLDEVRSAARQMLSVLRGIDAAGAAAAASAAAFRQASFCHHQTPAIYPPRTC